MHYVIKSRFLLILAFLTCLVVCMSGCGGPKNIKTIDFNFQADEKSNGERPVHVMIREVSKKSFLTETYADVADMVYAEPREKSLLAVRVILPGGKERVTLDVNRPDDVNIGVYGMFSEPGKSWRLILETPLEKKYAIRIKGNALECDNVAVTAD